MERKTEIYRESKLITSRWSRGRKDGAVITRPSDTLNLIKLLEEMPNQGTKSRKRDQGPGI